MNFFSSRQITIAYLIGALLTAFLACPPITVPMKAALPYSAMIDQETSHKFVEYTKLSWSKEKMLLTKFAAEMRKVDRAQAYIMAYGGRDGGAKKAKEHAERVRVYLVKELGMETGQVVMIDCGYKEKLTLELWVTPTGASLPFCYPTVDRNGQTAQSNNSFNASGILLQNYPDMEAGFNLFSILITHR